jgi:HAMP domain-containing protein
VKIILKRLKFVTHRKVQTKLALSLIVWFVVFLAVFVSIFLFNFKMASGKTDGMIMHDQLLAKALLVEQTKDLALWYGLAFVVYLVLSWVYIMVYSHRMTGPVFKLTKLLDESAQKQQWPEHLKFRKKDAFPELASAFNRFVEAMKKSDKK